MLDQYPAHTYLVEKWVQNGLTIGRRKEDQGTTFIHGALPGETVVARIVKSRSTHDFAIVESILEASPERIASDCPSFPLCGGCSFRHIGYEEERKIKFELLNDLKNISPLVHAKGKTIPFYFDEPLAYRNHTQIQIKGGTPGFFALHTNDIIPLPENGCLNLSPELNSEILEWKNLPEGRFSLRAGSEGIVYPDDPRTAVEEKISTPEGSFEWSLPPRGFFQNNRYLLGTWLSILNSWIPAGNPDTMELFSGSGIIGGYSRKKLGKYIGLDFDNNLLRTARNSFDNRGLQGKFARQDLYKKELPDFKGGLIIMNPPRAGLNDKLIHRLIKFSPATLIYSSCNPHTMNRDLGPLLQAGYEVGDAAIFDFFPRTPHLEMAMVLTRGGISSL